MFKVLGNVMLAWLVCTLGLTKLLGNSTTPGELSMHSTIESIGVVVPFSGDDNQNNSASVWYRKAGATIWVQGHDMLVDRLAREWRVSLVHLQPDTEYEIQVRFVDSDGVSPSTLDGLINTRPDYPDVGSINTVLYVPDDGDLQMVIDASSPGDTIRIRGGVYYTTAELKSEDSGTSGSYLTIEAVPGETVILDGSDPNLNDTGVNNWKHSEGSIYYASIPWEDSGCSDNTRPRYVGEQRGGESVRYLFYMGSSEWDDFLAAPSGKAYYNCGGRIYVETYDREDPDNRQMYVSKERVGLYMTGAKYVRIRGLEFRHYGMRGVHLDWKETSYNIIEQNKFYGIGKHSVRIGDCENTCLDNLVQDNYFYENGYRDSGWTWREMYDHALSTGVRVLFSGSGNVIRRNTFLRGSDGISLGWVSHDTDIYDNVVEECMDDGIEVDDRPGHNIRVWGNTIRYCFSSISNQSWHVEDGQNMGPVYIFRNVIRAGKDPQNRLDRKDGYIGYASDFAFKVGDSSAWSGVAYYYHNTIYITDSPASGSGIQPAGGSYYAGTVARNNLWHVAGNVFFLRKSTAVVNHDMDCDNLHNSGTASDTTFVWWSNSGGPEGNGVYRNLSDFQTHTGQETHGISDNGTLFNSDLSLQKGSPEIDAGCFVRGFNDQGPWAYQGAGPDIGAFEFIERPDLAAFTKAANPSVVYTGDEVTFTLYIENSGGAEAPAVTLVDALPPGLEYVDGTLSATSGTPEVHQGTITVIGWQGAVDAFSTVEVRYVTRVTVSETITLSNTALLSDGINPSIRRSATVLINPLRMYLPLTLRVEG